MTPRQEQHLTKIRRLEVYYRSEGQFETAVQCQMAGDLYEAHPDESRPFYSWFQRGRDRTPYCEQHDGMLGVHLPNGLVYWMTADVCYDLLGILIDHLQVAPFQLRETAAQIELEEWSGSSRVSPGTAWSEEKP